jgi:hypothetical protein
MLLYFCETKRTSTGETTQVRITREHT